MAPTGVLLSSFLLESDAAATSSVTVVMESSVVEDAFVVDASLSVVLESPVAKGSENRSAELPEVVSQARIV